MSTALLPPPGQKSAPSPRPLSISRDCLGPIRQRLDHLTFKVWDYWNPSAEPTLRRRMREKRLPWYLRPYEFHRAPGLGVQSLYNDCHLQLALTWLQVHHPTVAGEVDRRLRSPLDELFAVTFRSSQILNNDWGGDESETISWNHPIQNLQAMLWGAGWSDERRRVAEDVIDRWCGVRNDLRTAASYLRDLLAVFASVAPKATDEGKASPSSPAESPKNPRARHSDDFASVAWFGQSYSFTSSKQRGVVQELWAAWENSTPELTIEHLRDAASISDSVRMPNVFRGHPAWGEMIVTTSRGLLMLQPPKT
jgi:hypothetical protein